jgi:hypothetical protein
MSFNSYRIRESKERYAREEAADLQRWIQPLLDKNIAAVREIHACQNAILRSYYGEPIADLYKADAATAPVDERLELATTTNGRNVEAERKSFDETIKRLKTERGMTLSNSAVERLAIFGQVHAIRHLDVSTSDVWLKMFSALQDAECFGPDELTYNASDIVPVAPEPESQPALPQLSEIDNLDASTRDGAAKARAICDDHLFSVEARTQMRLWLAHLYRDYQYIPTERQQKMVVDKFLREGWNWLQKSRWDDCRRWLVSQGELPQSMLTGSERIAKEIEETDTTNLNFYQRRELNDKLRRVGQ